MLKIPYTKNGIFKIRISRKTNRQKQKTQTIKTESGSLGFLLFRIIFFCRVLDIRVPEIMDSDPLDAGFFTAPEHLMIEKALSIGKQSFIRLDLIAFIHIILQTVCKRLWDSDYPVAFRRFWRPDHISSIDPLKGLVDRNRIVLQIYICRSQGTQLTYTHSGIIQSHKSGI